MTRSVDLDDVQGLVRFGYGSLTDAVYVLARVRNLEAARAWLRTAPVSTAATLSPPPATALQIALTAPGMKALDVPAAVRAGFSSEFLDGMDDSSRARRLGDVESNAPDQWEWGHAADVPHIVVMLFAKSGQLDAWVRRALGEAWHEGFEEKRRLTTSQLDGIEPFGFVDGISQPTVDWEQRREPPKSADGYSNEVALGEFLLGYRNEYGKYTDRPLIDVDLSSTRLPLAEDAPGKWDIGKNGSYLVIRQLKQNVREFWQYVMSCAGEDRLAADTLASRLVGRTRRGEPLAQLERIPGGAGTAQEPQLNRFTFDDDPAGIRCPLGAHIRRANPRNADYAHHETGLKRRLADLGLPPSAFQDDVVSSVRFHRILRRGREFGPPLSIDDALRPAPPGDPDRGLYFICLNANISRQFEFIQNAWMVSTKFSALTGESDPLVGNRLRTPDGRVTDGFTTPAHGLRHHVSGLPSFVTMRGGAYFFLPGVRALRYLAGAP